MKILIIKPSSLGDIIHGLMVAQSIREQLPEAEIWWMAQDRFAPVVEGCPTVSHTFIFHRHVRRFGIRYGAWAVTWQMRQEQFDVVLDFHAIGRSVGMLLACRAKRKIGPKLSRSLLSPLYPEKAPPPAAGRGAHAVEILLQFLPLLGLKPELRGDIELKHTPLQDFAPQLVGHPYVLITPNSRGGAGREWPRFMELAEKLLAAQPDLRIVWDTPTKWQIPEAVASSERFVNLTGKTNLEQLLGLISEAQLVISNDSGPMHMAAALGTPLLAVFGPTKPEHTGPYPLTRPTHHVLCAPGGNLNNLDSETVLAAVNQALEESECKMKN